MIDQHIRELINTFMLEAKSKHGMSSGTKPEYTLAIGLVDVSICFEAFSNFLMPSESDLRVKRNNFSNIYQGLFEEQRKVFEKWGNALKKELDENGYLKDMTPNSRKPDLPIKDTNQLIEIIDVIYRVRSNLVHGSKDLKQKRDRILIENSFRILYTLLEIIFAKERI